jgi:hypothetical protein
MWRQATDSEAHGPITNTMATTCEPYMIKLGSPTLPQLPLTPEEVDAYSST